MLPLVKLKSNAEIDTAFDEIIGAVQIRRKIIKEQLRKKSKVKSNSHMRAKKFVGFSDVS